MDFDLDDYSNNNPDFVIPSQYPRFTPIHCAIVGGICGIVYFVCEYYEYKAKQAALTVAQRCRKVQAPNTSKPPHIINNTPTYMIREKPKVAFAHREPVTILSSPERRALSPNRPQKRVHWDNIFKVRTYQSADF